MRIKKSAEFKQDDNWQTPPEIIELVRRYQGISFDCASSIDNRVAERHFTVKDSFLRASDCQIRLMSKEAPAWCNPPFSKAEEFFQRIAKSRMQAVCIFKATNLQTKVWQDFIFPYAKEILFLRGRTSYIQPETGKAIPNPPFNSALIFFNCECKIPEAQLDGVLVSVRRR